MAIAIGLVVVLAALVAVAIAYGIYLSNLIRDGSLSSRHGTPPFDIIASSEGDGTDHLARHERAGESDGHSA